MSGKKYPRPRAVPLLAALDAAPRALSTAELAERIFDDVWPPIAGVRQCITALHRLSRVGLVDRAGTGRTGHGNLVYLWQITPAGHDRLART